ncbi:ParB/RepB/Spo0J family partition protein [Chroococcidiopsis sp. CCNUC1]|uniref:ParB/RepB/Spo0J family partition protein n=1 Tax=Chroococcidiopsis sp. CCNUC1 TaxID=2653189 RepID=UPI000D05A56B|nr:ParB/RepB/Spo0J family partition protein [Chroococcidiopsis sp. CCNUC1]PSB49538.1 hypothetical protein C7B80_02115 [Cyanosarcina cf. burmensis CCALA 770]URD53883.1 ParB N-terminal domain-containing protein [Chroococcidiopsis sp. CCNUC1]
MSQIELSLILTDGGTQPRASLNPELINEYAEAMTAGAKFPPAIVFYDGTSYWLADGFHRLEAAKKIESPTIAVDIRQGSRRDAVLHSVGANAIHGLRRSNADKRRAVLTLLGDREWCLWSNREVAKQCGVGEWLVRQLKEELSACDTQINQVYARKCGVDEDTLRKVQQRLEAQTQECMAQRQGTTYTISTASISKRSKKVASTEKSTPTEAPEAKPTDKTFTSTDKTREQLSTTADTQTPLQSENGSFVQTQNRVFDRPYCSEKSEIRLLELNRIHVPTPKGDKHFLELDLKATAPSKQFQVGDYIRVLPSQNGELEEQWTGKTARVCQVTTDNLLQVDVEGHEEAKLLLSSECVERIAPETVEIGNERPGNENIEAIDRHSQEYSEVVFESKPEASDVSKEVLKEHVRIISIEQEKHQQVEEVLQTFEVILPGARIEIEGHPSTLVTLFQQMQSNPTFAEEVLRQAQLLTTSSCVAIASKTMYLA